MDADDEAAGTGRVSPPAGAWSSACVPRCSPQGRFMSHDVGVLVTHHGTSLWVGDRIDEETREYLSAACPQAVFVPFEAAPNAGQMLVPHVDAVVSVSSSIGMQARFWGKRLIAPGWSHLAAWSDSTKVEALADGALPPARDDDAALAWLMRHYWADLWRYRELLGFLAWRDIASGPWTGE